MGSILWIALYMHIVCIYTLHLTIHLFPSSPPLRPAEGDEALRRPGGALDAAVLIDQALAEEGLSGVEDVEGQGPLCFLVKVAGQMGMGQNPGT